MSFQWYLHQQTGLHFYYDSCIDNSFPSSSCPLNLAASYWGTYYYWETLQEKMVELFQASMLNLSFYQFYSHVFRLTVVQKLDRNHQQLLYSRQVLGILLS